MWKRTLRLTKTSSCSLLSRPLGTVAVTSGHYEHTRRKANHRPRVWLLGRHHGLADGSLSRTMMMNELPGRRPYITLIFLRGGAAIVSVFFAYIGFQVFNRLPFRQRGYIRKNLRKAVAFEGALTEQEQLWLQRPNKVDFLVSHLQGIPNGPLVVTGPEGSGKTGLLRQVLSRRPNTIYVDMREHPVTSGHEFIEVFTRECGYLLPPNELLGRAIFTQAATLAKETDKALDSIVQVLKQLKHDGVWGDHPPTICVDEITRSMSTATKGGNSRAPLTEDKNFQIFLDWCIFLTSSRLAHVVLSCTPDIADEIDARASFAVRRQKLHIDYPRNASVKAFFSDVVNDYLQQISPIADDGEEREGKWKTPYEDAATELEEQAEQRAKGPEPSPMKKAVENIPVKNPPRPLSTAEIDTIINSIGGHLNDIDVLIGQISQGQPWQEAIQRLLADSVQQVENLLEGLYCCGDQRDSDHDAFLFQTPPESVYHNAWDLSLQVTHKYKCFLRCFAMIELLSKRKWVHRQELANQIFPDRPSEIDDYVDRGILVCVNLNSSAKIVSGKEENVTDIDLSRLGVHGRYVSAAAPRLRTAFRAVCQNRRMQALRQRIRSKVQLHSLRAREQHLSHELQELSIMQPMALSEDRIDESEGIASKFLTANSVNRKTRQIQEELHEIRDTITRVIEQLTQTPPAFQQKTTQKTITSATSTDPDTPSSGDGANFPSGGANNSSPTSTDGSASVTALSTASILAPTRVVSSNTRFRRDVDEGVGQTFASVSPWWSIGDASVDPDEEADSLDKEGKSERRASHSRRLRIGW